MNYHNRISSCIYFSCCHRTRKTLNHVYLYQNFCAAKKNVVNPRQWPDRPVFWIETGMADKFLCILCDYVGCRR